MIFNDGALLGFRAKPKEGQPFPEPLNDFMIKDAAVSRDELIFLNIILQNHLLLQYFIFRQCYSKNHDLTCSW